MGAFLKSIAGIWCKQTHGRPFHPVQGMYRCRVCLRQYPVPWSEIPKPKPIAPRGAVRQRLNERAV